MDDLLVKLNWTGLNSAPSPCVLGRRLSLNQGTALADSFTYRSTIGALQYLTYTRPDISFILNHLSQFLQRPTDLHWLSVKQVMRYLI